MEEKKKKIGRPTKFTPEVIEEILRRLARGESGYSISKHKHLPGWTSLCAYKRNPKNVEFLHKYTQAREDGLEVWEHKILEISDNESRDYYVDHKGIQHSDNTAVNRDRLRIDTRKWTMSKLFPKKYGERVETEVSGSLTQIHIDAPPKETREQWNERIKKELESLVN
jgi:hypothetical protein